MKKRPGSSSKVCRVHEDGAKAPLVLLQETRARCQGDGVGKHPDVYLFLKPGEQNRCPYCRQVFQNIGKEG